MDLKELTVKAERELAPIFSDIDRVAYENTAKVLEAFRNHRIDSTCFDGTSGYGYDDKGREALDRDEQLEIVAHALLFGE